MAGLLCAAWVLSLALLVFRTANPLTLNTAQVKFSSWIVEAGVRQLHPGKVEVVTSFRGSFEAGAELTILNLDRVPVEVGKHYLLPLVPGVDANNRIIENAYLITPTGLPEQQPLVYPMTEEVRAKLQDLLRESAGVKVDRGPAETRRPGTHSR